jgi:metal-sulfur cluster biosynthetic enzyme
MSAAQTQVTHEQLTEAVWVGLDQVIDPCSVAAGAPAGLVTMGMVSRVNVDAGTRTAEVTLKLTHPSCFMAPFFLQQVRNELASLDQLDAVEVDLDEAWDWTPAEMDEGYRELLEGRLPLLQMAPPVERNHLEEQP